MSVRKLRNSWWADFRFGRKRYRKRSPDNSQAGAKAYELILRQRIARGDPIGGKAEDTQSVPTFAEFSAMWFKTYVITNNKHSAQNSKRITLRTHLVPFFGRMKLAEITSLHIEQFKAAKLEAGLAPQTVNNHLTILGKCLRCAAEWGELPQVPKIKKLKTPPQKFDFLSREESERLLRAIDDPLWYALILLALRTGLRVGELMALEWSDIDFDRHLLCLRKAIVQGVISSPKNNRVRYIPLTPQVCDALKAIQKPSGFLTHDKRGRLLTYYKLKKTLQSLCVAAGLRPVTWHKLRHSFASHLVASGVSLKATQELLGHSTIDMTLRYAHLAPSALRSAVETLDHPPLGFGQQVVNV